MTEQQLIGRRLATARHYRQIKQVDLGAAIGVTDQTVSNWEVGVRTPRADLLRKICQELNCSADFILGLSDQLDQQTRIPTDAIPVSKPRKSRASRELELG